MTRATCGCTETYPQLRLGKLSHGPGCAAVEIEGAALSPGEAADILEALRHDLGIDDDLTEKLERIARTAVRS